MAFYVDTRRLAEVEQVTVFPKLRRHHVLQGTERSDLWYAPRRCLRSPFQQHFLDHLAQLQVLCEPQRLRG